MKGMIFCVGLLLLGSLLFLFEVSQTSNCGGNSAALSSTSNVGRSIFASQFDGHDAITNTALDFLRDNFLRDCFSFGWGVESYWLKKDIPWDEEDPVVICAQQFSNVPRPSLKTFFMKNPAHAAWSFPKGGFLLTPEEVGRIDLSEYVRVDEAVMRAFDDWEESSPLPLLEEGPSRDE